MARIFRRPRHLHPVAELNITNMVDLGFTLLIIFMISTPLIQKEQTIPVNLPVESKSPQTKADPDAHFETIVIKADGGCILGARPVALNRMKLALTAYAAEAKPPIFRIRMDAKVTAQQFVTVMDALKQNNLSKFTIDTEAP
jgi:biopolymer transport protein TolR